MDSRAQAVDTRRRNTAQRKQLMDELRPDAAVLRQLAELKVDYEVVFRAIRYDLRKAYEKDNRSAVSLFVEYLKIFVDPNNYENFPYRARIFYAKPELVFGKRNLTAREFMKLHPALQLVTNLLFDKLAEHRPLAGRYFNSHGGATADFRHLVELAMERAYDPK